MNEIRIIPLEGIPEIVAGDDIAAHVVRAAGAPGIHEGDVVVIAHKVVSKAEGRVIVAADRQAVALAESAHVLRRSGEMVISETHHGFVCANAGVDASNMPENQVALLPQDPDLSARRIKARVRSLVNVDVAVIISDTFGRAWRLGQTNVAIGVAGFDPFIDYRGTTDAHGRELTATRICIADELASSAELAMGKREQICAVIIRGVPIEVRRGSAAAIVRPTSEDLFR